MSFKRWTLALICLASTSLSGCTDFLEGKKRESEVIELSDTRFKCLRSLPKTLKGFSVGEAAPEEIRSSFDCVREALLYFQKKTYGSIPDAYTANEMRSFFGKYFLKENNVSPEFALELMKAKAALLGGSTKYITKTEISVLLDVFATMREQAVDLAPHIRVLLMQADKSDKQWDLIAAGIAQLRKSLHPILEKTQFAKSEYSFDDFKKALAGFSDFVRGSEPFAPYEKYSSWVPLVEAVKNLLLGQHAQISNIEQWKDGLDNYLSLYELALKYSYVISGLNYQKPSDLRQLSQFLSQGLDLLSESHQMKISGRIPLEDIDALIDQLLSRSKLSVRSSSVKETYRWILMRVLDPERNGDTRGLLGLEKKHLAAIRREFSVWRLNQSFVDVTLSDDNNSLTQEKLVEAYKGFAVAKIIDKGLTNDPIEQRALRNAWADLGETISGKPLVNFTDKGELQISPHPEAWTYNWKSLTKLNLMNALARVLVQGYGTGGQDHITAGVIKREALIRWYDDFNNIGLDLKAFDPRSNSEISGGRSFLEANFFTFSGNGDKEMSHRETLEFVSVLFSSGLLSSSNVTAMARAKNCGSEKIDLFGHPFFEEKCFKQNLRAEFKNLFANLPGMVAYVNGLNDAQWEEFYNYLREASQTPNQEWGFVETANIRTMVTIVHYVESVMLGFDQDANGGLSLDEVYAASPRFMTFFREKQPSTPDTLLEEGFAYLLFRGKMPGATDLIGFQLSKVGGMDEIHRMEVLRLFGTIKDLIK
jgi:hypothetical protein